MEYPKLGDVFDKILDENVSRHDEYRYEGEIHGPLIGRNEQVDDARGERARFDRCAQLRNAVGRIERLGGNACQPDTATKINAPSCSTRESDKTLSGRSEKKMNLTRPSDPPDASRSGTDWWANVCAQSGAGGSRDSNGPIEQTAIPSSQSSKGHQCQKNQSRKRGVYFPGTSWFAVSRRL